MQSTEGKQFYLICGVRLAQRWRNVTKKYANHALLCIMLGQRWVNVSNLYIADSAKVTKCCQNVNGGHNFDFYVLIQIKLAVWINNEGCKSKELNVGSTLCQHWPNLSRIIGIHRGSYILKGKRNAG